MPRRRNILWIIPALLTVILPLGVFAEDISTSDLPDAPSVVAMQQQNQVQRASGSTQIAPRSHRTIEPYQVAQKLRPVDKFEVGLRSGVSVDNVFSSLVSAGFGQAVNSTPHYGTNAGAFGERFGASTLKGVSEGLLTYGVFANVYHQDPRYYVYGDTHPFFNRVLYSASRVVVTRNDRGQSAVNWSKLSGEGAAVILQNAYFPDRDRGVESTARNYAVSLGAAVLDAEFHEFIVDALKYVHLKH